MHKPLFAHRPPSTGVHLLSDPLPEFIAHAFSGRANREEVDLKKKVAGQAKTKKPGLRS